MTWRNLVDATSGLAPGHPGYDREIAGEGRALPAALLSRVGTPT